MKEGLPVLSLDQERLLKVIVSENMSTAQAKLRLSDHFLRIALVELYTTLKVKGYHALRKKAFDGIDYVLHETGEKAQTRVIPTLTEREYQSLKVFLTGLSYRAMAKELGVNTYRIKNDIFKISSLFRCGGQQGLIFKAMTRLKFTLNGEVKVIELKQCESQCASIDTE